MLPFFKVFSLIIRLFTRPLSNYFKNSLKAKDDHHPYIKNSILELGQFYHRINIRIQRKMMNISVSDSYIKPLSDEKALEQGSEFIGEIVAYGTLLILGIYEINKYSQDAQKKDAQQKEILDNIYLKIDTTNQELLKKFEELKKEIFKPKETQDKETSSEDP